MTALISQNVVDNESAGEVGLELSLSVWDALMLGRVSATGPGLRAGVSNGAQAPVLSPTANGEVA